MKNMCKIIGGMIVVVTMPLWYIPAWLFFAVKYKGGWREALREEQGE